ncbi:MULTISPECIES: hypothetical protein [Muribaculaceae]|uniref:hypothetical protein n=1 Tax=Muribaculaceae TaxID=2005473 RepID=UPI00263AACB7|nr:MULTISPECIES: hypothetical protein [Muribaculaceae]
MNKTISFIRIAILFVLGMFAILFIFGEEQDANLLTWMLRVIVDKALGFGAVIIITRLYKRWSKVDPWFIAYDKMCDKVMEKPNPSQL